VCTTTPTLIKKAVLQGNCNEMCKLKNKYISVSNLTRHINTIEKQEEEKLKMSQYNEIMKMRTEINKIETKR
jgi:hypothetical protein